MEKKTPEIRKNYKNPGKLGKILLRPKNKSSLHFGCRIRKNTPDKFRRRKNSEKYSGKIGKILPKSPVPAGKITFFQLCLSAAPTTVAVA